MRAEGFFCNLDILYGGLGISKLQFLIIKALDPDWIRIGVHPKMLDPDPEEMNADPQPCLPEADKYLSDIPNYMHAMRLLCIALSEYFL